MKHTKTMRTHTNESESVEYNSKWRCGDSNDFRMTVQIGVWYECQTKGTVYGCIKAKPFCTIRIGLWPCCVCICGSIGRYSSPLVAMPYIHTHTYARTRDIQTNIDTHTEARPIHLYSGPFDLVCVVRVFLRAFAFVFVFEASDRLGGYNKKKNAATYVYWTPF